MVHDLEEAEKVCACGANLSRIGEEVSEKLDIIPAKIQVIRQIRYKDACKNCEGVESEDPTAKIVPPSPELIPKGLATAGLVAHITVAKYADALPLYRQEKISARHGIELTRIHHGRLDGRGGGALRTADEASPKGIDLRASGKCRRNSGAGPG